MKKYKVTVEEVISEDFEIIAENCEQARDIAIEKYKNGELVLAPGNLLHKQLSVNNESKRTTEWVEF